MLWAPVFGGMPSRLHEIAQVADGEQGPELWMQSSFLILNQNRNEPASVEIRFYDDDGVPMELRINGSSTSVYQVMVPKNGSTKITTDGKGAALRIGSATISASTEVGAQVFFQIFLGDTLITQAAIEPTGSMQSVDIFADYDVSKGVTMESPRTGYAIANLSKSTPVEIAIWLYPEDGSDPIWSHVFQLPARGHTARYLDQDFPSDKPFRGTARITAGGSITVTALQAQGVLIGTLPPIRRPLYSRFGGE
jgi:hypothetical protein